MKIIEDKIPCDSESKSNIENIFSFDKAVEYLKKYTPTGHFVYVGGNHIALINYMNKKRVLLVIEK